MRFTYAPIVEQHARDAVFERMQAEGLTACAMSSIANPTLAQWQAITAPQRGVLLGCYRAPQGDTAFRRIASQAEAETSKKSLGHAHRHPPHEAPLLACAMFSPRRGRVWEFDFTTFRLAASQAVPMAREGLDWAFNNLDCSAVMGLCPVPNRHAWRLAEACGFRVLGRLPHACLYARKQAWVDGVLVLCTPQDIA